MPVKMIAARRHYVKTAGKEVEKGESFSVDNEREADRLIRMRRATRAHAAETTAKPAAQKTPMQAAPNLLSTAMKAEDTSSAAPLVEPAAAPRRYRRRDLQAQD